MGSVTAVYAFVDETEDISTHTLRGERDNACLWCSTLCNKFQLTRSVGSVTTDCIKINVSAEISTHTLRGERDVLIPSQRKRKGISTHTLRGERDVYPELKNNIHTPFQLTRSVGSVTLSEDWIGYATYDFNSHAPWGA